MARHVAVSGSHAFVADGVSGLRVFDISNPTSPSELGSILPPDLAPTSARADRVVTSGSTAFVAGPLFLQVVDVSDPTSPQELGVLTRPTDFSSPRQLAVAGSTLFWADGQFVPLRSIDVSDPARPRRAGFAGFNDAPAVALTGSAVLFDDLILPEPGTLSGLAAGALCLAGLSRGRRERRR